MGFSQFLFIIGGVLLLLLEILGSPPGFKCRTTKWSSTGRAVLCSSEEVEVYSEIIGPLLRRFCCQAPQHRGEDTMEELRRLGQTCTIVPCQEVGSSPRGHDTCAGLPRRFINSFGVQRDVGNVRFQQEIREPCLLNGNITGAVTVCCPRLTYTGAQIAIYAAEPFEFPYIAHIYNRQTGRRCGGAIYNSHFVITAARCVVSNRQKPTPASSLDVLLGTNIALQTDDHRELHDGYYTVVKNIIDPNYSGLLSPPTNCSYNDFALLKLSKEIRFSDKVQAIRIAPAGFQTELYSTQAISAGWGIATNSRYIPYLRKTNVIIRDDAMCFRGVGAAFPWNASCDGGMDRSSQFLCVGGLAKGEGDLKTDTTNPVVMSEGNAGSPVVCRDENGDSLLCGIVSLTGNYGKCLKHRNEAACRFTRASEIAYFRNFIKETAGEQQNSIALFQPKSYGTRSLDPDEFAHQVYLLPSDPRTKPCTGTLISKDTIITAGQCVVRVSRYLPFLALPLSPESLRVVVGLKNVNSPNPNCIYRVKSIEIAPNFRASYIIKVLAQGFWSQITEYDFALPMEGNFYFQDLAIIKLAREVYIPEEKIAKLPNLRVQGVNFPPGIAATTLSYARQNTKDTGHLMKYDVTILSLAECRERFKRAMSPFQDFNLCGVEKHSGGSLCDRHIGGGVVRRHVDEHGVQTDVLVGVQVFRSCELSLPNIYMNVRLYTKWISELMEK